MSTQKTSEEVLDPRQTVFTQLYYKRETGEMSVSAPDSSIAPGDVITTHNKTVFEVSEVISQRKAFGKFKDESSRPVIYIIKGVIISKHRWEYNQIPSKNKTIAKEKAAKERAVKKEHASKQDVMWGQ